MRDHHTNEDGPWVRVRIINILTEKCRCDVSRQLREKSVHDEEWLTGDSAKYLDQALPLLFLLLLLLLLLRLFVLISGTKDAACGTIYSPRARLTL